MTRDQPRVRILAIFAGAFLGPFAGILAVSILPEIAMTFGIATEAASLALVANVIPFAGMMLISGSISVRIGKARTVKIGYAAYIVAAIFCYFAPTWETFLIGYAASGFSNALTTPVLMSILKDVTRPHELGKHLGWYASMQAVGQLSAPLLSGVLAITDWKLIFLAVAFFATALLIAGLPQPPRTSIPISPFIRWRSVWRVGIPYLPLYFVLGLASLGIPYLISLYVYDSWSASSVERGTVIMLGGVTILACSSIIGTLVDKFNARIMILIGTVIAVVGLITIPFTITPVLTTVAWCIVVLGGQTCIIALNKQVLTMRGSDLLISVTQSLRFFGNAFSPVLILPFFLISPFTGFWVCASLTLLGFILFWIATRPKPSV